MVPSMSVRTAPAPGSRRSGAMSGSIAVISGPTIGSSIAALLADRNIKLAAIATAAGAFSGLFGVGGGTVIVPLLMFWFAYPPKRATGTSLAAIVLVATLAAAVQGGIYGNVHLGTGLALSVPAVIGVVAGTALQQRISQRVVSGLFALLLVVIAVELIIP